MSTTAVPSTEFAAKATRARIGVGLLILGDGMFVAGMAAGTLYLTGLNVLGQFKGPGEHAPSIWLGLLLALVAVAAAAAYWWARRSLWRGDARRFSLGLRLALALILLAFVAQIVVLATLGFSTPLHGYGSTTILLVSYHALHLLIAGLVGVLILGRLANGRLIGQEYLVEVVGYWWYYVAAVALLFWAVTWISSS